MFWLVLVVLFVTFDVNYFIRVIFTGLSIALSRRNLPLTETVTTYGICTTQDIDVFLDHMNNGRFLRELDFARYQWFGRTRLWARIRAAGAITVQGATTIRYRRMIAIGQPFRIETKLVWWDDRSVFFEHRFVTLLDGWVRAVAISRQVLTKGSMPAMMEGFAECAQKPERPAEIGHWLDAVEASSLKLRQEQNR